MTTRRSRTLLLVLTSAMLIVACGDDDGAGSDTVAPSAAPAATTPPAATTAAAESAYPVTIEHKYGSTTIEATPERVVVVGLTEQDALLALGVVPVGVTDWFGDHEFAVWPWALPLLGDAKPTVLRNTDGLQLERIAALAPDVIIGLYAGLTDEEYGLLTAIAPTVAQPAAYVDWGIPWQEQTRTVGQIIGKAEEADQLVTDVEAKFAEVRAAHPEFAGASAAAATPYEGVYVYGPEDVRGRFLADLGFEMPAELTELVIDEFGFQLSPERVDLLDTDVLVWLDVEEAGDAFGGALYESLAVHTEGREVFLNSESADALGGATSYVTVVSLPYLLDGIVPMLAAAIDGDPATTVAANG